MSRPADSRSDKPGAEAVSLPRDEAVALCRAALGAAGASRRVAELLTETALFAEDRGRAVVGVAHLLDHIQAIEGGRLDGCAVPELSRPSATLTVSDARGGIAQTGFDEAFSELVTTARRFGIAAFSQRAAFTCGALGWFTERLAQADLVAIATAVSPAVLAAGPGSDRVFGTNPLSLSVPCAHRDPLTFDQACSSTAYVSVRNAAARGEPLPQGWAVDADGQPTTDAEAALAGALLPFGGYKGANIALLVELLSSMAGGNWAMDAPAWDSGSEPPAVGMFVLAIDHSTIAPGFPSRVTAQLTRLADAGMRLPGASRAYDGTPLEVIELAADVAGELRRRARIHQDGP